MMGAISRHAMKKPPSLDPPGGADKIFLLDRDAFVIKPTSRFLTWLESLDSGLQPVPDEISPTIYMTKELPSSEPEVVARCLARLWPRIAEEEFNAWWTDPADWPEIHGLPEFFEYFECTRVEMVFDLEAKPLRRELA